VAGAGPGEAAPTPCDFHYPSDRAVPWRCVRLGRGESLESRFGERWSALARFNRIDRRHAGAGTRLRVPLRLEDLDAFSAMPAHYSPADSFPRFILVDQAEQYLGAYEHGRLAFALPVATGSTGHATPNGRFRIDAAHRRHASTRYPIAGTNIPYPMHYALRFHVSRAGTGFWLHGRDLPGRAASHGCIGLYDEEMQKEFYGVPARPELADARRLYEWVVGAGADDGRMRLLADGPPIWIMAEPPRPGAPASVPETDATAQSE
jgi:hypothetical protein